MDERTKRTYTHDPPTDSPPRPPKSPRYNLKSFVDISKTFRWCPGRGCDFVAMGSASSTSASLRAVLCRCGVLFCFRCGEEAHVPATCDDMVTWNEKCRNESETANWILANTRKCPRCLTRIEKNQGCNHMTCRQCKHEVKAAFAAAGLIETD